MPDDTDLREGVATLHEHLEATEELPIDAAANRWLGEAQAVVADVDGDDAPVDVVAERLAHVARLLENVEDTGHAGADDHVTAALELARAFADAE